MRITHVLSVVVPLSLTLGLGGCAATETANTQSAADAGFARDTAPLTTDDAMLTVRGLSCPKCANNVNLALGRLTGVSETHIDMGKGEVHVVFDPISKSRPSKAQLAKAITDAGFTIVDIRAN